jgi:DnaJ-class molecular chaperone
MSTHYDILGVSQTAGDAEIKKAYRQLSLQYHPDRNPDPSVKDKYKLINDAYDVLSDPQLKEQYDHKLKYGDGFQEMGFSHGGPGGVHDILNMMFSMGGFPGGEQMFAGGGGPGIHIFHNGVPVNGFHDHMFRQLHKPPPIVKAVEITMEQSYHGATIPVSIDRQVSENGLQYMVSEILDIEIPRGTSESDVLILRNKGHSVSSDVQGDLKLTFKIINNTIFTRNGLDLIYTKHISLKDALCGFSFEINHLNGKILNMNNRTNHTVIKPGYKKVVPGLGFIQNEMIGSLILELIVDFPDSLTVEQVESLKHIL